MKLHFISGLPRSGSTLLASILRQNPKFHASIMSPVGRVITDALVSMSPENEAHSFISEKQRRDVLTGIFDSFYKPLHKKVIFDNNRRWTCNASGLATLYPGCKIICCVRSPAAIVDSFERLTRANPLALSKVYGTQANLTVYQRTSEIMSGEGVVGFALNGLRDAFFGPERARLCIVNYDDLCRFPSHVLSDIHKVIGEDPFPYDFDNIESIPGSEKFDEQIATPGLHDLKPKVIYEGRMSILPPDLFAALPKPFWLPPPVKETATKTD